jgi:hypothetical protein
MVVLKENFSLFQSLIALNNLFFEINSILLPGKEVVNERDVSTEINYTFSAAEEEQKVDTSPLRPVRILHNSEVLQSPSHGDVGALCEKLNKYFLLYKKSHNICDLVNIKY